MQIYQGIGVGTNFECLNVLYFFFLFKDYHTYSAVSSLFGPQRKFKTSSDMSLSILLIYSVATSIAVLPLSPLALGSTLIVGLMISQF